MFAFPLRTRLYRFHAVRVGVLCLSFIGFSQVAHGLSINLVPAPAGSTLTPAYDPNLLELGAIMQAAADYWEGIILNNHTVTVTYGYLDLSTGVQGQAVVTANNGFRATTGAIALDIKNNMAGDWFFDPTPYSHTEFAMQQVLYRDLTGVTPGLYYDGAPPELQEVGYWGNYVGPDQGLDALTTAVHELGHILGLSQGLPTLNPQINDGDYDFNPLFVQGNSAAVRYHGPGADDRDHVRASDSLMAVGSGNGDRNLPSATDLFALASVSNWTLIDMPRKDFWGGGATNWNAAVNWTGNRLPDAADVVHVRNGASANLTTANGQAGNLFVQENSVVSTGSNTLNVASTLVIEGALPGAQANVVVNSNGRVTADTIRLNQGGLLTVTAGITEEVEVETLDINSGGILLGNGDVRVNSLLSNNGTITAIAGAAGDRLSLLSGPFDLDGNGDGQVNAVLGNIRLSGSLLDAFDGVLTIGANRYLEKFGTWEFGENSSSDGELRLQGGNGSQFAELRQLSGSVIFEGGTTQVSGDARISGSKIFESGAQVQIDAASTLTLDGNTIFRGGTYTGDGRLRMNGSVTVDEPTVIDVHGVDLDFVGVTSLTFANSRMTLNVHEIDDFENRFDGTMQMNGFIAGLTVNLADPSSSWVMDGTLSTTGGTGLLPQTMLAGSEVRVSGTMNTDGVSRVLAPMVLSGTLNTADGFTQVQLANSRNVIENTATFTGAGTLVVNSGGGLVAEDGTGIGIDLLNRGRFEPGAQIGVVNVGGDFVQEATGTFAVDIVGAPGGDHDRLNVTGSGSIDGALEVSILNGFAPEIGHVYTLMAAPTIAGTFDTVSLLASGIFTDLQATVSYPGDRVQLVFTDVELFGDFNADLMLDCADVDALVTEIASGGMQAAFDLNGDSLIDVGDLELWLSEVGSFNVGGPYLPGDANLDGFVDESDFDVWNGNKFSLGNGWCGADFNADGATDVSDFHIWNGNKFASSVASAQSVPEPTELACWLFLAAALIGRRRSTV